MSVTAVPLQPLSKGTIAKLWIGILLVILLGVGLAWIGTASQQFTTTENGLRYRVLEAGEGDEITAADVALARLESRGPSNEILSPAGQPGPVTSEDLPAPLRPLFLHMKKGGSYQIFAPVSLLLNGQTLPPEARIKADDTVQFRFQIMDVERGGAAQMRMMQSLQGMQGGGGMGAPSGAGPMPTPPPARPGGR